MSSNPKKGVVDSTFRVYGTENVYVCDASVFPSSITVNPQLTVLALAAYAADEIAGSASRP
jgi:choline dehydrogenase-like flavoprotein